MADLVLVQVSQAGSPRLHDPGLRPGVPPFRRGHIRSMELIAQPCLVRAIPRCAWYGPYLTR